MHGYRYWSFAIMVCVEWVARQSRCRRSISSDRLTLKSQQLVNVIQAARMTGRPET